MQDAIGTPLRDSGGLIDADMRLEVAELYPGDPTVGWVPAYRFAILVRDEIARATLIEVVDLPTGCEMYREGYRQRCRGLLTC